jgi:hypothetical protein
MIRKLLPILFASLIGFSTADGFNSVKAQTVETDKVGYGQYFISNGSVAVGGSGNYARYWYFIIPMDTMNSLNDTDNVVLTDDIPNVLRHHLFGGFIGSSMNTKVLGLTNNDDTPIFNRSINMANSMYYGERGLFSQLDYTPVDLINREYHLYQFNHNDNVLDNYYHLLFELQGSWSGYIDSTYLSTEEAIIKGIFGDGINEPCLYSGSFSTYWYELGYNDGYADGDLDGYNRGINEDFNAYSYLFGMFGAFSGLFAVELLPGLTIGGIAILVLSLTLLPFLIGLFTKGGKK